MSGQAVDYFSQQIIIKLLAYLQEKVQGQHFTAEGLLQAYLERVDVLVVETCCN